MRGLKAGGYRSMAFSIDEQRKRKLVWAVFAAAAVASLLLVGFEGRNQTLIGDQWGYAKRLATLPLLHVVFEPPPGKYLLALPMFAYKAAFTTIGVAHWLPYRLASIALTILVAGLFFILAARRVGYLVALPAAVVIMFLGSASEVTATALRMPEQVALAAGLGMFLAFERHDLRGDIFACLLLLVSITSHPMGTAFLAAAAVLVLARPAPQRWQRAWVFVVPGALFAAWYLTLRSPAPGLSLGHELRDVPRFEAQSLSAMLAGVTGIFRPPAGGALNYLTPLSYLLGAGAFVAISLKALTRPRAEFWALLAAVLVLFAAPAFAPGQLRTPEAQRYILPGAVVLLLLLSETARGLGIKNRRARLTVATVVMVVFGFSIYSNAGVLRQQATAWSSVGVQDRAELTALDLARGTVSPTFRPEDPAGRPPIASTNLPIGAYDYFDIEREFGSPAYQPSQLDKLPAPTRRVVDVVLARALRLQLEPAGSLPQPRGDQPRVIATTAAKRNVGRGCLTLVPTHRAASSQIELPTGGAALAASGGQPVQLALARFGDQYDFPLNPLQPGKPAILTIPSDAARAPWRLLVANAQEPVRVCGLAGTGVDSSGTTAPGTRTSSATAVCADISNLRSAANDLKQLDAGTASATDVNRTILRLAASAQALASSASQASGQAQADLKAAANKFISQLKSAANQPVSQGLVTVGNALSQFQSSLSQTEAQYKCNQ